MKAKTQLSILVVHPRYGLCNKIINWAKAYVWAKENNAKLIVKGWTHFPIGSILRGEKTHRWYGSFFKKKLINNIATTFLQNRSIITEINQATTPGISNYEFKATPYISDLPDLANYHKEIIASFYKLIKPIHIKNAKQVQSPIIGIHIRRGDFVKIGSSIDLDYYIHIIKKIRFIQGKDIPVTIFSDGYKSELKSILGLNKVKLFDSKNDLIDLLVMAKSKILITTLSSSFSYWAAFMANGIVLHHPKTWVPQCRPKYINNNRFEGPIPESGEWPTVLLEQIKQITS